jgi:hypothetical protein
MQECIADVELPNSPVTSYGEGKNKPNGGVFNNWTVGVEVVEAVALGEALSHQTSFEFVERTVGLVLDLEDPPRANDIAAWRRRHQRPGALVQESSMLIFHSLALASIKKGAATGGWLGLGREGAAFRIIPNGPVSREKRLDVGSV